MHSPITLDCLRVIEAIDRKGSFAAAAQELHRVPSAVSYTVSKLEESLGVEIFDRSKRKAALTEAGKLVLAQGREILLATEELTTLVKQVEAGWEVSITLGVDSVVNCGPLYQVIAEFQQLHPKVDVQLLEEVLGGTWDALNSGRCDLIVGAPGEPPGAGFEIVEIGQMAFVFAVAGDHPLAQHQGPIALEAIHAYPTVVMADSSRNLPLRSSGLLDGRSRVTVPNLQKKIEAQVHGLGVGYLPRQPIAHLLEAGALVELEIARARPVHPLYMAWRKSNNGKALKWFVERVTQFKAELLSSQ